MTSQQTATNKNSESQYIQQDPLRAAMPAYTTNVNNLGYFLDGWADLIEGMGDDVEQVRSSTFISLRDRAMPDINVRDTSGTVSMGSQQRRYTITTTSPGATTAIYIGKHGKDLYVSWRTFINPVPNWKNIGIALGCAAFLGLLASGMRSLWIFLITTILLAIFGLGLMAIAGRLFKGNFLAFFFIEPTIFDADDITGMSLSAHKSLLRALDNTGIDVTKLRLKQNFKGGRRGEDV